MKIKLTIGQKKELNDLNSFLFDSKSTAPALELVFKELIKKNKTVIFKEFESNEE